MRLIARKPILTVAVEISRMTPLLRREDGRFRLANLLVLTRLIFLAYSNSSPQRHTFSGVLRRPPPGNYQSIGEIDKLYDPTPQITTP
jgi:hypothetical protein